MDQVVQYFSFWRFHHYLAFSINHGFVLYYCVIISKLNNCLCYLTYHVAFLERRVFSDIYEYR